MCYFLIAVLDIGHILKMSAVDEPVNELFRNVSFGIRHYREEGEAKYTVII
jgi:hypothetical protein